MRALVTSGGGAKGAFTVGALKYLQERGIDRYDIISGTSTGSFIAALVALGQFDKLVQLYTSITNNDILKKQNIANNFLQGKPYVFDTSPLLDLINQHIRQEDYDAIKNSSITLCLTAISLQTGKTTVFTTKNIPPGLRYETRLIDSHAMLVKALLASGSQAGFLKPVDINGEQFVDGGNRDVIPSQVVVDQQPDEIYLMSNNPRKFVTNNSPYTDVINVILRAISIFIQEVREDDIAVLLKYKHDTGMPVYIVEPAEDHDLDPQNPTGLRFDRVLMNNWLGMGRTRAREIVFPDPTILLAGGGGG